MTSIPPTSSSKFQYRVLKISIEASDETILDALNQEGRAGWQLWQIIFGDKGNPNFYNLRKPAFANSSPDSHQFRVLKLGLDISDSSEIEALNIEGGAGWQLIRTLTVISQSSKYYILSKPNLN